MPRNLKTAAIPYILLGVFQIFELLVAQDSVIPYGGIHFRSSSYFERVPNSVIEGQHITSSYVYDAFACQVLCIRESRCLSFNFGLKPDENGLHLCEIFEIIRNYGDIRFIQADLFDFYSVPSGKTAFLLSTHCIVYFPVKIIIRSTIFFATIFRTTLFHWSTVLLAHSSIL
jgi:hypothetical protein